MVKYLEASPVEYETSTPARMFQQVRIDKRTGVLYILEIM